MKSFAYLMLCGALTLLFCTFAVFAQGAPVAPPVDIDLSFLAQILQQLATSHPFVVTAVLVVGTLRLCVKPIMEIAHAITKATKTDADDKWLDRIESSRAWRYFVFGLDWLASVKLVRR